jgi:hypothetical protein
MSTPISFFVIATKSYRDYARNLISDLRLNSNEDFKVCIILLTDITDSFLQEFPKTLFFELKTALVPSYGWPEATLFRFQLMLLHQDLVAGEIVAYIDADMRVSSKLATEMFTDVFNNPCDSKIALVKHPGYAFRSKPYEFLCKTHFGPWGVSRTSTAWVPRKLRSTYVCGGLFWGQSVDFFKLCKDLERQVETDESNNVRAKHNDESHLNRWSASNQHIFMGSEWVYAPGYRNLKHLTPIISVVHKPASFVRISSFGEATKLSAFRKVLNSWQKFLKLVRHD